MAGHLASKLGGSYPRYGFLVFVRDSTRFDFVKISLGRRTEDFTSHALELLHDGVAHPSNIQRDARCDSCALKTLCTVAA